MATQQVAPVTCPNCGARFNAPVQSIIDGQDPAQKATFLQGQLNVVQCPQCGAVNRATLPILYYDLEKELALVFTPNAIQLSSADQEKIIGSLTNTLVNSLPAEQRKFYLFNPKPFLSLETMVKAVLEAEGITEEMLQAQADKVKLLEELMQASDEATLKDKIKANDSRLDREFFEILTASMQAAQYEGNQAGAQALFALRSFLAENSSQGAQAVAEIDAELGLVYLRGPEDLLDKLQNAQNEQEFEQWIAAGYALLDYTFFQQLTAKIDEAEKAKDTRQAKTLKDLRTKILEIKGRQEEQSRAALQKASELLRDLLQSSDPAQVLEERLPEVNEAFFAVLSANIQEAQRRQQNDFAQALEYLGSLTMKLLQDRLADQTRPKPQPATPSPIHLAK